MAKYVDADAALKRYKGYCGSIGTFSKLYADWLKRVLAEMPAADVQEVRHGKWITDGNGVVICSECREEHIENGFRPPYCDMCGSKMDGGGPE